MDWASRSAAIAIYPREGTETSPGRWNRNHRRMGFIPARGRKQVLPGHYKTAFHCNLSPRGDGNRRTCRRRLSCWDCNLSPRGDGNKVDGIDGLRIDIAIYPREGTETSHFCHCKNLLSLQFIPARGRKRSNKFFNFFWANCNLSPRGDGNRIPARLASLDSIAIYPREGTETD